MDAEPSAGSDLRPVTPTLLVGRSHKPGEMRVLAALRSDSLLYNHASPTRLTLLGTSVPRDA